MEIVLIGLSHKTAPVEVRERFSIPQEQVKNFLGQLVALRGVQEGLILSTCNRMEVLVVMEGSDDWGDPLKDFLAGVAGMNRDDLAPYLYTLKGEDAVRHLFCVTASMDSMVLGEPQILGQVKEAYRQAVGSKAVGLVLNKLSHRSFFIAKRVRTETRMASQAVSVSFAAVELAKKIMGNLDDKRAMLIGTGEMSELAAKHLISHGVREIWVTNRTPTRAMEMAQELGGRAVPFEDFPQMLKDMDIVLSSTGSSHYIILKEQLAGVIRARKNKPMFFIDIAVPRDVDPTINELDNIYVYDIDDLQGVVESNIEERRKEVLKAEGIVHQGVEAFKDWLDSLEVVPTILDLRQRLEKIRQREMAKTLALLKNASEEEQKALDLLTQSIINKILHHPISLLKHQESREQGKLYVDITRKIFHLDEEEDEPSTL
ncbi:MAG: glutamyl-tRNA reductase [Deltaproteobacteria bacterium]|nr:glutamyl-tRNA reductase [Deltaproteobacteria bacterium]